MHPPRRLSAAVEVTKAAANRTPQLDTEDPMAAFCRRVMLATKDREETDRRMQELGLPSEKQELESQEERRPADDAGVHKEAEVEGVTTSPVVKPLENMIADLDLEEEEEREYQAILPYLPDLGGNGKHSCAIACIASEGENPMLRSHVRVLQKQRPDLDFEELMSLHAEDITRAAAHVPSERGYLECIQDRQHQLLHEERAWMEERKEVRLQQRAAEREVAAREAARAAVLASAPRNTKIMPSASSSSLPSTSGGVSTYSTYAVPQASTRVLSAAVAAGPLQASLLPTRRGSESSVPWAWQTSGTPAERPHCTATTTVGRSEAPRQQDPEFRSQQATRLDQARLKEQSAQLLRYREDRLRRQLRCDVKNKVVDGFGGLGEGNSSITRPAVVEEVD